MKKQSKRILFISPQPFFQWRGSPIRVGFNLLALSNLGYEVDFLTLPIGEDKDIDGVRIIRVPNILRAKNIPIGPSWQKIIFDILLVVYGFVLCWKNRYDVVHGVEEAGFIGAFLAKIFSKKAIFEKHSDPFSYKKGFLKNCVLYLYAGVEKLSVRMADAVIGTGQGLVDQVKEMGSATKPFHIFDIPSSLSEPSAIKVAELRGDFQNHGDQVLITFVGSFAVYQGVELMFAAIPLVIAQDSNAKFLIIGGNGDEIAEKTAHFKSLGCGDNVLFLGKIPPDSLPDYLAASDILLSPRFSGVNTPLKVLDYMKAGRSIVATDIPSNRLLLDEDKAVLAPADPQGFANGIVELVKDQQKRDLFGGRLLQLHKDKYNFKEYSSRLKACYEYVLNSD